MKRKKNKLMIIKKMKITFFSRSLHFFTYIAPANTYEEDVHAILDEKKN